MKSTLIAEYTNNIQRVGITGIEKKISLALFLALE